MNESPRRLKVLMSAYACGPNHGSEPEVGWQWAVQMARFHDVTVLTSPKLRKQIEEELSARSFAGSLRFVFHNVPAFGVSFSNAPRYNNFCWQYSARKLIHQLQQRESFDLFHHVTYAAARYPVAVAEHDVPWIWGPVGGIESAPWSLLIWKFPVSLIAEAVRNVANIYTASRWSRLQRRARGASIVISSTKDTQKCLERLGVSSLLMPAIGIHRETQTVRRLPVSREPLKLLYVGKLIFWKGVSLALQALAESGTDATLTLMGDGPFYNEALALADELGIRSRVEFLGNHPHEAVLAAYSKFDALLYPSLHDSGAFVVLEAMSDGLPVICLDLGGPGLAVEEGGGWKVFPTNLRQTVRDLAEAIRAADRDREGLYMKGNAARESVMRNYDWNAKGDAMNVIYQRVVTKAVLGKKGSGCHEPAL